MCQPGGGVTASHKTENWLYRAETRLDYIDDIKGQTTTG
ncbi:hypothetical protein JCM19231_4085 [Vibrio ishigakensis]|uniref:Uncharacterized protein n=1 Tax=Vibrio ishigakensis TaxID=1481914 RepID=A0A0B8P4G3_9VIBR|nr:hypothetical protein JCM19231_4085 [Vibrio ishigakensis]